MELAIVLVIIGLLLGGILKGQALITSAKIKRVNNDFNGLTAAVYTYLDRYGALPGDDDKAFERWGPTDVVTDEQGDGNGSLDGNWDTGLTPATACAPGPSDDCETYLMWKHLYKANLVGSPEPPKNAFGGHIGIEDLGYEAGGLDSTVVPAGALGINGIVICMDKLTGEVAEMVDINFDDGEPDAGLLKAVASPTYDAVATDYEVTEDYLLCKRI